MRPTVIYGLHNGDGEIRYVGKTLAKLTDRLRQHRHARTNYPVNRWIRKTPVIHATVLEKVPPDGDWRACERAWIAALEPTGRLLNLLAGGEGAHLVSFTPERRERIAAALRTGRNCPCEACGADVWVTPYQERRSFGRYCSRSCKDVAGRGPKPGRPGPAPQAIAAAADARRTRSHCKRGHPLSGENLYRGSGGRRVCRTCQRSAVAAYKARLTAAST